MGTVIGDILPLAIGVAISLVPIIAVILMLFSKRARSNGEAFMLGWVITLALVQAETAPVVAVAIVVCSLLAALFAMRQARNATPQVQTEPQPTNV